MSAPRWRGCCIHGVAKVLSTATSAPWLCAMAETAAMSMTWSNGFVGVSIQIKRGLRHQDVFQLSQIGSVDNQPGPTVNCGCQAKRSAITICLHDEVIARIQQAHDGVLCRQPTGECEPEVRTLKEGQMGLETRPARVSRPRVLKTATPTYGVLLEGRGQVHGSVDRSGHAGRHGRHRAPHGSRTRSPRDRLGRSRCPQMRTGGQSGEHVGASDDTHGMATIKNNQGRRSLQPPDGDLDLFSGPDSR